MKAINFAKKNEIAGVISASPKRLPIRKTLYFPRQWIIFLVVAFIASLPVAAFAQSAVNLSISYIQVAPDDTEEAYQVSAFVSAVNETGDPVQNLELANFALFEDSQPVKITAVRPATDVPVSLILVIDTSESMSADGLVKAKRAGAKFLQKLSIGDQVAVIGFNSQVGPLNEFTSDFQAAQDQLNSLKAKAGSGSCIFDAAYKAMTLASTLPPGRRAIILLTDGKDETIDGRKCSSFNADDVINLANGDSGIIPMYTLGLGGNTDENSLKRMAELTGGTYMASPDSVQLEASFDRLNQQLKEQYELKYVSTGAPGTHKLAAEITVGAAKDQSLRTFSLPALPARIRITSPQAGKTFSDQVEIITEIIGNEDEVKSVRFEASGQVVSTVDSEPYSLVLDLSKLPAGNIDITAVAQGSENNELARDSVNIIIAGLVNTPLPDTPVPAVAATQVPQATATPTPVVEKNSVFLIGSIVGGGLLVIGLILFLAFGRKKESAYSARIPDHGEPNLIGYAREAGDSNTVDEGNADEKPASLTVLLSDDASLIGKKFPLRKQTTRIGRDSSVNDLVFENDKPVSREHLTITMNNHGGFILEEVLRRKSGELVGPTYGTFVNENRLTKATTLADGDQIRLGNRLKLLFEAPEGKAGSGESTIDDMDQSTQIFDDQSTQGV